MKSLLHLCIFFGLIGFSIILNVGAPHTWADAEEDMTLEDELLFLVVEGQSTFTRMHRIANSIVKHCLDVPRHVRELAPHVSALFGEV